MHLNIKVENFGKIKSANIDIKPFTLIAGRNSSGKSFITRALYSFFSVINKDHVTSEIENSIENIKRLIVYAKFSVNSPSSTVRILIESLTDSVSALEKKIEQSFGTSTLSQQLASSPIVLVDYLATLEKSEELHAELSGKKKYESTRRQIAVAIKTLAGLRPYIENPNKAISNRVASEFSDSLKENFQTPSLSNLRNFCSSDDAVINFDFESLGKISIKGEVISFSLFSNSIDEFQKLHNVVYLESPVYWKLRTVLDNARKHSYPSSLRSKPSDRLIGVPRHFYDLLDLISTKTKINEDTIYLEDIIKSIDTEVDGELAITEAGEIIFKDNSCKKELNISTTASGITNLGLISLLLKKNIISKGSFLFFDEPEINLHPAWQRVMVETLYSLSKNGVNVVLATHSIDMVKCIENVISELDDDEMDSTLAVNHIGYESDNTLDTRAKLEHIKFDLGTPFYEMYMEGSDFR